MLSSASASISMAETRSFLFLSFYGLDTMAGFPLADSRELDFLVNLFSFLDGLDFKDLIGYVLLFLT